MSHNDGVLFKSHFGGEHAHTDGHPPMFAELSLDTAAFSAGAQSGQVVMYDDLGKIVAWDGVNKPLGVVDFAIAAGEVRARILIHGCARTSLLKATKALDDAAFALLWASGIFPA